MVGVSVCDVLLDSLGSRPGGVGRELQVDCRDIIGQPVRATDRLA
jgi:hypothetical protein